MSHWPVLKRRRASGGPVYLGSELAAGKAAAMNPDSEEPFLKEAGKMAVAFGFSTQWARLQPSPSRCG